MFPGPVFHAELIRLARRKRYYVLRFVYGLTLLYLIGITAAPVLNAYGRTGGGALPVRQLANLGRGVFATFAFTQAVVVLLLTPAMVAGVVADERQRKTLPDLLASCLSSGEIVLGKLASRAVGVGVFLGVGLPILALTSFFGGVDPDFVMLYFAACSSTAFLLSAASVALSVHARRPREAVTLMYLVELIWLFGPTIVPAVFRMGGVFGEQFDNWTRPVQEWVGASSPFDVLVKTGLPGMRNSSSVYRPVCWMIGLQVLYGAALATFAVARLRPVQRADVKAGGQIAVFIAGFGKRLWRRPPCGDDPILWKECRVSRSSPFARVTWSAVLLALTGALVYWTYQIARPAYDELVMVAQTSRTNAGAYERRCQNLNEYLRLVVTLTSACWMVAAAVVASGGLSSEREGDTWFSLIATPLTPVEIVRAKMVGAFYSVRWVGLVWCALLLTGLLLGAIHPVGIAAVVTVNAVNLWFVCGLGTTISLHSRSSVRAVTATVATLIGCNVLYLFLFLPFHTESSFRFLGVSPYINVIALMSYPEVRAILDGQSGHGFLGFGSVDVMATYLSSLIVYALAAGLLTAYLVVNFDDAVDRPRTFGGRQPRERGDIMVSERGDEAEEA